MKNATRITVLLLMAIMIVATIAPMTLEANAAISTSTFNTKVQEFISDARWKNGIAWGDSQKPKLSNWSSTGCCAYAADFVAYVYGSKTSAWTTSDFTKFTDLNEIRAGDIIHTSNHWFVVVERNGNNFYTVEGNFDDKVRVSTDGWGIKNGVIYNLKASNGARTFEYGYHYKFSGTGSSSTPTTSSSTVYYNIDLSAQVLASRINQRIANDCAIVSMATVESYLYNATSSSEKDLVYNALVSKNTDNDYAYWSNCGYLTKSIDWSSVYEQLAKGYPCIVHRPASGSKDEHWAVVAGYKGSTTTLEKDKFIIVDVYRKTTATDIYTSAEWRGSVSIDRMAYRKNGIAITSLSGIRYAINHPAVVHHNGNGHGVYGYITSDSNLTEINFKVTNVTTEKTVYNKTVKPNSKSYLVYNLDSEFTFAKWGNGDYFYTITAKTASTSKTYNQYFNINSVWPTTKPNMMYTINFDDGVGGKTSIKAGYLTYFTIPEMSTERSGYEFVGWNMKREVDGTYYCTGYGWLTEDEIAAAGCSKKLYKPCDIRFGFSCISDCLYAKEFTYCAVWEKDSVFDDMINTPPIEDLLPILPGAGEGNDPLVGDVNADGTVDMFDYLLVKGIYFESVEFTEDEYTRADANNDGEVDMFDYLLVKNEYFNA